ncbi:hypothetical protein SAMN03080617_03474 [Algoriphagus alkaliphilus]|jgi:predicted P-loop ATPase/GTPase|uniref:Uncharacterized protein n=1 Tax=Algoriphagus alkaliphilus TaxID=279824 RepID=A0A1G5ZBF1_9BACT|nr:hypothetical protein [Algoriphagus alkaliphilus]MBA4302035.1 hypothetical protein [Cyclobacterium sp.]SDA91886.1 hypothetical protein SAMN03080617_03474 [Algoriphagus alkaliphilus]
MKITLEIDSEKASAFLNFIRSLDFIKIKVQEDFEEPTKEEILQSIEAGLKEVKDHLEGKIKLKEARTFLDEL